jgi:hypothetical protein
LFLYKFCRDLSQDVIIIMKKLNTHQIFSPPPLSLPPFSQYILPTVGLPANIPTRFLAFLSLSLSTLFVYYSMRHALQDDCDVDERDADDETALHYACLEGFQEGVQMLVKAGAGPNFQNKHGATPLHHASRRGYTAIVDMLVGAGADKDIQDEDGDTPLHLASMHGFLGITETLITGDNVGFVNNNGKTPFDYFHPNWISPADQQRLKQNANRLPRTGKSGRKREREPDPEPEPEPEVEGEAEAEAPVANDEEPTKIAKTSEEEA